MDLINFKLASQRGVIRHLKGTGCLRTGISHNRTRGGEGGGSETGNRDTPESALFIKVGLKLLIDGSLDIKEGEDTSDIEEKSSRGEVLSWTDPYRRGFQYSVGGIEPRAKNWHLLPNPNIFSSGSLTEGSSFPSFRYRSGLNLWGSG